MSLKASEARRLASETDQRDNRAFFAGRRKIDDRIRLMSKQSPAIYFTKYRLPPYLDGVGSGFNYNNVVGMLYTSLIRDGYRVGWDEDDPSTLFIDWSPSHAPS